MRKTNSSTTDAERAARDLRIQELVQDLGKLNEGTPMWNERVKRHEREVLGGQTAEEAIKGRHEPDATFRTLPPKEFHGDEPAMDNFGPAVEKMADNARKAIEKAREQD